MQLIDRTEDCVAEKPAGIEGKSRKQGGRGS